MTAIAMNSSNVNAELPNRVWRHMLLVDALLYASLFWRDYAAPGQMLIAHYISFVAITDLAAFFLPRSRRHWFNLFRFSAAIAFVVLICALLAKGLDGEALALSLVRLGLAIVRLAHAGWCIKAFGPQWDMLKAFPSHARSFFDQGTRSEKLGCGYLALSAFAIYFPQVAYWTHYNWGMSALDDVLTGMQAQSGINFFFKLFVFEALVIAAVPRLYMRSVVAILFAVQWPLMLAMFYKAPIPLAHAAVELFGIGLMLVAYQALKVDRN